MIPTLKLDYTIESPEERKVLVEQIIAENENLTPGYLEVLANYLVLCMEKQEKKERKILTDNRLATVNKREHSLEGLAGSMKNGEDSIYGLIKDNNKNTIFKPKISITKEDIETIPPLKELRKGIQAYEDALKQAKGTEKARLIKKALIEMRRDQYIIKSAYLKPIQPSSRIPPYQRTHPKLEDTSFIKGQKVTVQGLSLMDPKVTSAILRDYSRLRQESYDQFTGDLWYLIRVFDDMCDLAFKDYPIYERIVQLKIDKKQNLEIQETLKDEFGVTYSIEYLSSLWRNKLPKLIAEAALESFLTWHYRTHNWPMKKCSKCGQIKPAHNQFFSKNNTSRDHYYSICKKCRNKKRREEKEKNG